MFRNNIRPLIACITLVFAASAANASGLELTTKVEKRHVALSAAGVPQETFVPATKVVPGDVVAYTIQAKNGATEPASNVVITDPIPQELVYVEGSGEAAGAELLFSIDGGFRFAPAGELTVTEEDGTSRPAAADDYTHIRWVLTEPIAPAADRAVRFEARLL